VCFQNYGGQNINIIKNVNGSYACLELVDGKGERNKQTKSIIKSTESVAEKSSN